MIIPPFYEYLTDKKIYDQILILLLLLKLNYQRLTLT